MRLTIYVPKDKADVLRSLEQAAMRAGRPKNAPVLEALERYVTDAAPTLPTFHLGEVRMSSRTERYEELLDQRFGPRSS